MLQKFLDKKCLAEGNLEDEKYYVVDSNKILRYGSFWSDFYIIWREIHSKLRTNTTSFNQQKLLRETIYDKFNFISICSN